MGGGVGGGDLCVCSGGGLWFSCGVLGSFSDGSNDGCLRVFSRRYSVTSREARRDFISAQLSYPHSRRLQGIALNRTYFEYVST